MTAKALLLVDEGSRLSCYVLYRGAAHVYFRRMPPALHGVLAARYESWSARRRLGQALVLCANNIKAAVGSPSNKPDMAWLLHGFCDAMRGWSNLDRGVASFASFVAD